MCEKTWGLFETLNWACSFAEIPWRDHGFEGAKLGYLLNDYGLFHNGHRASDDCRALLHLLASPLRGTEGSALATLLQNARQASVRLWAKDSPFEAKDLLKARGYRWADGTSGPHRSWWTDVREDVLDAELAYLRTEIFKRANINPPTLRMTARERYSMRGGIV